MKALQFSGIEFVWGHDLILFAANALNRVMETELLLRDSTKHLMYVFE